MTTLYSELSYIYDQMKKIKVKLKAFRVDLGDISELVCCKIFTRK